MTVSNADIQATQDIIRMLEHSKSRSDLILDLMPGILLVVDEHGVVLKGNAEGAIALGRLPERISGANVASLFSEQDWSSVRSGGIVELEHPLELGGQSRNVLWRLCKFEANERSRSLFAVIGQDVTDVKAANSQLVALAKDVEVTGAVQALFLPKQSDISSDRCELASYYQPADRCGGDWWCHVPRPKGGMALFLGDVLGHGTPSAMITAAVSGLVHPARRGAEAGEDLDIPKTLAMLDISLRQLFNGQYWMSMLVLELSPHEGKLRLWNAGAPRPLVLRANGIVELLEHEPSRALGDTDGLPLVGGVDVDFGIGDRLFAFTDGLLDLRTRSKKFSFRGLKQTLEESTGSSSLAIRDELAAAVTATRKAEPLPDDVTFVLLDRKS